jgi:hypothetical protein
MNWYEEKQERRRERLEAKAGRLRREGEAKWKQGELMFSAIPFGQPILVGHHSEGRDRRYRERARNNLRKGAELTKEAQEAERRAESVGSGGISSDDPAAVVKLREQLVKLEERQAKMAAANKLVRKYKATPEESLTAFAQLGFPEGIARKLFEPDFCGRIGFPAYELTNNGANIRRIKARIQALGRKPTETKETEIGNVRLVENAEINRVQLFFPAKPASEIRQMLKTAGFKWAPTEGAWQRQLSAWAVHAAQSLIEKIGKGES